MSVLEQKIAALRTGANKYRGSVASRLGAAEYRAIERFLLSHPWCAEKGFSLDALQGEDCGGKAIVLSFEDAEHHKYALKIQPYHGQSRPDSRLLPACYVRLPFNDVVISVEDFKPAMQFLLDTSIGNSGKTIADLFYTKKTKENLDRYLCRVAQSEGYALYEGELFPRNLAVDLESRSASKNSDEMLLWPVRFYILDEEVFL